MDKAAYAWCFTSVEGALETSYVVPDPEEREKGLGELAPRLE